MLETLRYLNPLPRSLTQADDVEFALGQTADGRQLLAWGDAQRLAGLEGAVSELAGRALLVGPASAANAAALRTRLSWLRPQTLALCTSAGLGDRLGLATPGHVRAVRSAGGDIAPIFAQQSIREMARTERTPQQVMDDAMWGVFAEGWREPWGADADHLKTPADVDACLAAGYTFFTIDPGDHVDNRADSAAPSDLRAAWERLPWAALDDAPAALSVRYLHRPFDVEETLVSFDEPQLLRAAVKYGRAVAHVVSLYRHLQQQAAGRAVELEVSVDETETPTTPAEHLYIAIELRRLGVRWVSLAPRYCGRFEKGVDYIGDLAAFVADFALHAAIARQFGPYKLSLHSGSDKFSIYAVAARYTGGLLHLKTAGTSYLEALRTIAAHDPQLFRQIYTFARERYESDRATYHVSAQLDKAPLPQSLSDDDLPQLLSQFDARQIFHVTFGSVLTDRDARFADRLLAVLRANPEAYADNLERHFLRHLQPMVTFDAPGGQNR